jgi:hypothetical protein
MGFCAPGARSGRAGSSGKTLSGKSLPAAGFVGRRPGSFVENAGSFVRNPGSIVDFAGSFVAACRGISDMSLRMSQNPRHKES